jgi:hypothetical protein
MAKRNADLSKMVTFDLSPSEAHDIAMALKTFQAMAERLGAGHSPLVEEVVKRIEFQLKDLLWPEAERRKAPFPV